LRQLSFLEQRPLFQDGVLRRFFQDLALEGIPESARINAWIKGWLLETKKPGAKETALEQSFNNDLICHTLGYRLYPGDGRNWTAWPKPPTRITGLSKEPDLLLGHFGEDNARFEPLAVVELKKPGTALDAPQSRRGNKSSIDQAFEYAVELPTCRWVIATDMGELRLYSSANRDSFIDFHLAACSNGAQLTDEFRRVYFLLRASALIDGGEDSTVARLLAASSTEQLSIQNGFYRAYSAIRLELLTEFERWTQTNQLNLDKKSQILAVQRLLDRMLFIYFCEDHPDRLLPRGLVRKISD
jgi:hypothetical protein